MKDPNIVRGIRLITNGDGKAKAEPHELAADIEKQYRAQADAVAAAAAEYMRPLSERIGEIIQSQVADVVRAAQEQPRVRPREELPVTITFESPMVQVERLRQSAIDARKALAQEIAAALREQAPQAAPARVEESQGKSEDKRTRTDCLKDAMIAAVSTLRSELGRNPNMGEVRGYLRDRDTSGFIKSVSDTLVTWVDWKGNRQTADARNLKERLDRILE